MLLILGISCKMRAVALFEDINIDDGIQNHTCRDPDGSKSFTYIEDNVTDGYNNAAW